MRLTRENEMNRKDKKWWFMNHLPDKEEFHEASGQEDNSPGRGSLSGT